MPATAIVVGSGPKMWDDLLGALEICGWSADLMAVNRTALDIPRLAHMCSLHPDFLGPCRELRRHLDYVTPVKHEPVTHSCTPFEGVDRVWTEWGKTGTSSLFGVRVMLALGYERVILAGIPLDDSGRYYDPDVRLFRGEATPHIWKHHVDRGPWELAAAKEFDGRVTSMSGWTQELLGGPE